MDQNVSRQSHSDADDELLSAYLDGQLSAAERLSVERRLVTEPRLEAELDALQSTVALLRELPPVAAPRSFTLDPATLPRQRWTLFPPLRLATAVMAVLLALTFTPDLLGGIGGGGGQSGASAPMSAPAAATSAPAAAMEAPAAATSAPAAAMEAQPQTRQATAAAEAAKAPLATTEAASGAAAQQEAAPAQAEAPTIASGAAQSQAAPAQADAPVTTQNPPEVAEAPGGVTSNAPPISEGAYRTAEITASDTSSPDTRSLPPTAIEGEGGLPWWRWAQIFLAALTLMLGAATLWARTRAG